MTQPRNVFRTILKVLAYGCALLILIFVIAHFAWKYSGSNEWKLVQDKRGVKVYAMKTPGATLLKLKAVTRVNTTLNRVAATFNDTSTEGCRNFVDGCDSGKILKAWDDQTLNYTQAYRISPGSPFAPRDVVIKTQMSRDPQTRALLMEMTAQPDLTPVNDCCVRMTHLHNRWRFTPAADGMLDVEFLEDDNPEIPYFLFNKLIPMGLTYVGKNLDKVCNKDKYGHTEYAFLN